MTTDTRPQPTIKQSIDTGLARLATSVLTWPIGLGVFAGRVSDATGLTKSVTGADPAPAPYDPAHPWVSSLKDPGNAFQALDEWTRFGTAEPNNLPQKILEDAPSILSVPSLLGIGGGLTSEAVVRGREIRDALQAPATGASEGYLTALGGGEAQPLGPAVPQGPQTSTPQTAPSGTVAPQPSSSSSSGVPTGPETGTSPYKITLGTPYSSAPKPQGPYNITLGAPQPPTQQRTSFDPSTGYQITLNEPVSPDVAKTNGTRQH
jgi:hypothetical protein